jgi:hypothetical protein
MDILNPPSHKDDRPLENGQYRVFEPYHGLIMDDKGSAAVHMAALM